MTLDDKYTLMLGKHIYNKALDKFGYISSIEIMEYIGGYGINLIVYYDTFHHRDIAFLQDFEKGTLQFALITDYEPMIERHLEDIRTIFGDKFSEDMILYISEEERKAKNQEKEERNIQMLSSDLVSLTRVSSHVIANDFGARELYLKYKDGSLTQEEMLYAMINHLAYELQRREDSNSKYFFKYEFLPEIEEIIKKELDVYDEETKSDN